MAKGRKTGGRGKGTPNKATAEIREHAQQYTIEALEGLALIARNSTSDAARVSAWNALLDRGHGKPNQGVDLGVEMQITKIQRVIVYPQARGAPRASTLPTSAVIGIEQGETD